MMRTHLRARRVRVAGHSPGPAPAGRQRSLPAHHFQRPHHAYGDAAGAQCAGAQGGPLSTSGVVDVEDLMLVAANWHVANLDPRADVNGDGSVDVVDAMRVAAEWRAACPSL